MLLLSASCLHPPGLGPPDAIGAMLAGSLSPQHLPPPFGSRLLHHFRITTGEWRWTQPAQTPAMPTGHRIQTTAE